MQRMEMLIFNVFTLNLGTDYFNISSESTIVDSGSQFLILILKILGAKLYL